MYFINSVGVAALLPLVVLGAAVPGANKVTNIETRTVHGECKIQVEQSSIKGSVYTLILSSNLCSQYPPSPIHDFLCHSHKTNAPQNPKRHSLRQHRRQAHHTLLRLQTLLQPHALWHHPHPHLNPSKDPLLRLHRQSRQTPRRHLVPLR